MADVPRIRINSPNVVNFDNIIEHPLYLRQNFSHISWVSIEKQCLKVWRSTIMDHLMTCQKLAYNWKVNPVIPTGKEKNGFDSRKILWAHSIMKLCHFKGL